MAVYEEYTKKPEELKATIAKVSSTPAYATSTTQVEEKGSNTTPKPPAMHTSSSTNSAQNNLNNFQQNAPQPYQSQYNGQIGSALNAMLNRDPFAYDMNNDPMYQQYKDQYVKQGQQAMRDTMGQAAALTGGYGNSYAATAGNQAYQGYLGKLNEITPELYAQALNQYTAEGARLSDNLTALQGAEDSSFNQYQGLVGNYYTGLGALSGLYENAYGHDFDNYTTSLGQYNADVDHNLNRDELELEQDKFDHQIDVDHKRYW